MDVSRNTISNIERGIRFAKAATIAKFGIVFDIEVSELFKTGKKISGNPENGLNNFGKNLKEFKEQVDIFYDSYNKNLGR